MTYRHYNCVFFNIIDGNTAECLKHKKTFLNINGFKRHCDDLVLNPLEFISHLLYSKENDKGNTSITWRETDKKAEKILDKYFFAGMNLK
ncbi:MAG: hypothetical protein IJH63_02200 [Methanobrevibacter sp.]|nr:hypothetical protein [Methanobrevibacter sp.]